MQDDRYVQFFDGGSEPRLEVLGMFNGESLWSAILGSALSIIGLILLYTRQAREYFGS